MQEHCKQLNQKGISEIIQEVKKLGDCLHVVKQSLDESEYNRRVSSAVLGEFITAVKTEMGLEFDIPEEFYKGK